MNFYKKVINDLLNNNQISINDKVLIVAGGKKDKDVFWDLGFKDVTISNLDYHKNYKKYEPYKWEQQDLEDISLKDGVYDWVFVHAGLHHCASPHKGLCEMLRVSKIGIGVIESRDSALNWIANKLDLTPSYEIEPCILSQGKSGGWRNSQIPNYVYKWTENEVKKTANSYLPHHKHKFHFYYGLKIPVQRLAMSKNLLKKSIAKISQVVMPIFLFLFKKQGNLFGFVIKKNITLQPWLKIENNKTQFDMDYGLKNYNPKEYKSE